MTNRQAAISVIERLQGEGHEALLAGGCVRDMLLGRRAKDYDVATSATPDQVISLFKRTIKVGAKFGVIMVLIKRQQVEVATFRSEADYNDGRRPDKVSFTNAEEDASRRDFTINGMFHDPITGQTIDYVGGREDLQRGVIRTIGRAYERFSEDYLRMLRAVRFSTRFGFEIERETFDAICANAPKITGISGERISMELEAILTHPSRAHGAASLFESGLADAIFPGMDDAQKAMAIDVLGHIRERIDYPLGLAALFAGCQGEFAVNSCKLLRLSKNHSRHMAYLLGNRGTLLDSDMPLSRLKLIASEPYYRDLYELQAAIQKTRPDSDAMEPLIKLTRRIESLGKVELRPRPLLNGRELIKLGAEPGPMVGLLAEELYVAQLEGDVAGRKQARQWVTDWLENHKDLQ